MWEYVITNGEPGVMLEHGIAGCWSLEGLVYGELPEGFYILMQSRPDAVQEDVVFHGGVVENGKTWSAFI